MPRLQCPHALQANESGIDTHMWLYQCLKSCVSIHTEAMTQHFTLKFRGDIAATGPKDHTALDRINFLEVSISG
ncbi:hypothetical protein Q4I32_004089 [Leishmania shawi]|uniref:Uncharacterized protein n=1 Tax=Leishmania shawi TaxID=5680 RepID=A0AAW3BU94_9TRYP